MHLLGEDEQWRAVLVLSPKLHLASLDDYLATGFQIHFSQAVSSLR